MYIIGNFASFTINISWCRSICTCVWVDQCSGNTVGCKKSQTDKQWTKDQQNFRGLMIQQGPEKNINGKMLYGYQSVVSCFRHLLQKFYYSA